jgi:galactokinase
VVTTNSTPSSDAKQPRFATPRVETPPVETPPVETPPVETPPVETPPSSETVRNADLAAAFRAYFGADPAFISVGPGRVNLIGEHTDYNGGFVLPIALKRDVRLAVRPRDDGRVVLHSVEYNSNFAFDLATPTFNRELLWSNYVMGVAWALQEKGVTLRGMDAAISGNVPRGSGLSSSAAIEVATAYAFLEASDAMDALSGVEVALAAQRAENGFVGVNCGIMDQFISVLGAENHALLIDCRSLDYERVPMPAGASLVIGNTKASRSLASSAYNERRAQCEQGVALLGQALPGITLLRDVSVEQLEEHRSLLPEVIHRRCRHVVHENQRVLDTVDALAGGDLARVGALMDASHESLRDDYEVSSAALDAMVAAMRLAPGCLGARLTGAGFGGCAVALVRQGQEQAVADAIYERYPRATNIWPEVYSSHAADGARIIRL